MRGVWLLLILLVLFSLSFSLAEADSCRSCHSLLNKGVLDNGDLLNKDVLDDECDECHKDFDDELDECDGCEEKELSECLVDFILVGRPNKKVSFDFFEGDTLVDTFDFERELGKSFFRLKHFFKDEEYFVNLKADCDEGVNPFFIEVSGSKHKLGEIKCDEGKFQKRFDITPFLRQCQACSEEICDGLDNDCDGVVDEVTVSCGDSDVGSCSFGFRSCVGGGWGECVNAVNPDVEVCNGLDDDCDGQIDEDVVKSCSSDVGSCQVGQSFCSEGVWSECSGVLPQEDVCDGLDNDCDGIADQGCDCVDGQTRSCGSDVGQCSQGTQACLKGSWGVCLEETIPEEEVCDGLDNDCDGVVDEFSRECGDSDVGQCSFGSQICQTGVWGFCNNSVSASVEVCDSLDNDCDGVVDESLVKETEFGFRRCVKGKWQSELITITNNLDVDLDFEFISDDSAHGKGVSVLENVSVLSKNTWKGEVLFVSQDADGNPIQLIESGNYSFRVVKRSPAVIEVLGGKNVVVEGTHLTINPSFSLITPLAECINSSLSFSYLNEGVVKNISIGDNNMFVPSPINRGQPTIFSQGLHSAVDLDETSLTWLLDSSSASAECTCIPEEEVCDGLDNDCDGVVDGLEKSCGSNVGQCSLGISVCLNGSWSVCEGSVNPVSEVCDGLDNDCDGFLDEVCSKKSSSRISHSKSSFKPSRLAVNNSSVKTCASAVIESVDYSSVVDIVDEKFNVVVKVSNPGVCDLYDVPVSLKVESGWLVRPAVIPLLRSGEQAVLVFDVYNDLCLFNLTEIDSQLDLSVSLFNQSKVLKINLNAPKISTLVDLSNIKNNKVGVCFLINEPKRDNLEVEFDLSDRKNEILFDIISPVSTSNDILVKKVFYDINVVRKKNYKFRSFLFEEGKLFEPSVLIADYEVDVDLSEAQLRRGFFTLIVSKIKEGLDGLFFWG